MKCITTQGFGQNLNNTYRNGGLKGHTGVDIHCGYGTPIYPIKRIFIYKVLDGKRQKAWDGSGFTGIFGIDEEGNEWLYGHCNTLAKEGRWYETNEIIGTEANRGTVFQGGVRITEDMKLAGDKRGSHRHIQKRPCVRVERTKPSKRYLLSYVGGYLRIKGKYYEIKDYMNGFNGCVDWQKLSPVDNLSVLATKAQMKGDIKKAGILWAIIRIIKSFS